MKLLITGGSSDIGYAIAERRLKLGDEVVITATSTKSLEAAQEEFKKSGHDVPGFVFDLAAPLKAQKELGEVLSSGLDGLVLNAASRLKRLKCFLDLDEEEFNQFVNANVFGNTWLLRQTLPHLIEKRFGRIVFISSLAAAMGTNRYAAYCTSKAAIEGLILNLANDYGDQNVLSNIIRPGIIATSRNEKFWKRTAYLQTASALIPQGKIGKPEQVAESLDALLSPTSYINGTVLNVAGGLPMFRTPGLI